MIVLTDKHRIPFQIDEEDAFAVSRYAWSINAQGYPATSVGASPKQNKLCLHLFLLGKAPQGFEWDHINRDRLDNRRPNLRAVTRAVNARNHRRHSNNTSGHNGVQWQKSCSKWIARIYVNGKDRYLGGFTTREEAVAARAAAEKTFWSATEAAS